MKYIHLKVSSHRQRQVIRWATTSGVRVNVDISHLCKSPTLGQDPHPPHFPHTDIQPQDPPNQYLVIFQDDLTTPPTSMFYHLLPNIDKPWTTLTCPFHHQSFLVNLELYWGILSSVTPMKTGPTIPQCPTLEDSGRPTSLTMTPSRLNRL